MCNNSTCYFYKWAEEPDFPSGLDAEDDYFNYTPIEPGPNQCEWTNRINNVHNLKYFYI